MKATFDYSSNKGLLAKSKEGDDDARKALILLNQPLVKSIAKRFCGRGYELEDLIEKNGLTEKLDIKAAFCLGNCVGAVCVKFNGEMHSVQPSNVGEFFENVVKKQVI